MKENILTKSTYKPWDKSNTARKWKEIKVNIRPVINSTIGYWCDIELAQERHFPDWIKKEKIGINSYQESLWLQVIHIDLPLAIDLPVLKRYITTFKKLPIIVPSKKTKTNINIFIKILYHLGPKTKTTQIKFGLF